MGYGAGPGGPEAAAAIKQRTEIVKEGRTERGKAGGAVVLEFCSCGSKLKIQKKLGDKCPACAGLSQPRTTSDKAMVEAVNASKGGGRKGRERAATTVQKMFMMALKMDIPAELTYKQAKELIAAQKK